MNAIRLECTTDGHNKFYELHSLQNKGHFVVTGLYGAIGQAPKVATIYDGDSKSEAEKEFDKKLAEKRKKGYIIVTQNGKSGPAPAEKKTLIFPQSGR